MRLEMTNYDKPAEIRVHCPICEMNSAHTKESDNVFNDEHPVGVYTCVICGKKILVDGFAVEGQGVSKPVDMFKPNILRRIFSSKQRRIDRARHLFNEYTKYWDHAQEAEIRARSSNVPGIDPATEDGISLEEVIRREGEVYARLMFIWCNEGLGDGMCCWRTGGLYYIQQKDPLRFGYTSGRQWRGSLARALGAEVIVNQE